MHAYRPDLWPARGAQRARRRRRLRRYAAARAGDAPGLAPRRAARASAKPPQGARGGDAASDAADGGFERMVPLGQAAALAASAFPGDTVAAKLSRTCAAACARSNLGRAPGAVAPAVGAWQPSGTGGFRSHSGRRRYWPAGQSLKHDELLLCLYHLLQPNQRATDTVPIAFAHAGGIDAGTHLPFSECRRAMVSVVALAALGSAIWRALRGRIIRGGVRTSSGKEGI